MQSRMSRIGRLFVTALLLALLAVGLMVTASADDLTWNLLTDTDAGYRIEDRRSIWKSGVEEDGTPYMYYDRHSNKGGALYIYDDQNILGSYLSFSLEGDFYFDSFPEGIRTSGSNEFTPEQRPLSFLCWIYKDIETGADTIFNAIRLDSEGYIHTDQNGKEKSDVQLETGRWYNIRCVFSPKNGACEMYIDGEKALEFTLERFDTKKYISGAVRYFDGYYNWGVKMKNLVVKTDSDYSVEMKREPSADYLAYQTAKPSDGLFSARILLGLNDTAYNRVGYEVIYLAKDEDGNMVAESISKRDKVIYESILDADGNLCNVKDTFGYAYAAAIEIEGLPFDPWGTGFQLVVRPYVLGMDGVRRYGRATTLYCSAKADENGYPVFDEMNLDKTVITASDDTYIFNGSGDRKMADYSAETLLSIRNPGGESSSQYRAAYFKFKLSEDVVNMLETASSATLRLYMNSHENNSSRKAYDLMLHGAGTAWTESELNYNNYQTLAPTDRKLYEGPYELGNYFTVDVLDYLCEQIIEEDGSKTVAFRLTTTAHDDVIAAYVTSKESDYEPVLEIKNSMYELELNLSKLANVGYEPWGYAEYLVNDWFDNLVDKVYPRDENGDLIYYDDYGAYAPDGYGATAPEGDYTVPVKWKHGTVWTREATNGYQVAENKWETARFARTLSTLGTSTAVAFLETDLGEMITEYDVYGGITNAGFTGEATGFFHTEKHGERIYVIDPLGNPFFAVGVNTVNLGATDNQKNYTIASYGLEEVYFERITRSLQEMGVNLTAESPQDDLLKVKDGLSCVVNLNLMVEYMSKIGEKIESYFNAFDPDFEREAKENAYTKITAGGYADMARVFAYTTDNELPSGNDVLTRYLTLKPDEDTVYSFSYATAWAWLARRMNTPNPTLAEYSQSPELQQMNSEFLSFLYSTYYRISRDAIQAVDPNHMYIGSRVNGTCYTDEGYHRAAGYFLDVISVNLYNGLSPAGSILTDFYRNTGKPFMVTEFFAKGMDAMDANGFKLANSTGAGILVYTQEDRAEYYEHYTMNLLEAKACVGWVWYRFRDNDQGIYTTTGEDELIMLHVDYNVSAPTTFMDREGNILPASEIGEYETVYKGEKIASNQNINKGFYNSDFSSVVTVYEYDKDGELISSMGYEIEKPESETPAEGTRLVGKDGTSFITGTAVNADGSYTETVLTVYEGKYLALAHSIRLMSDHLLGLLEYFSAE